ncbi:hypothetical protein [Chromobacterium violaceum]|uniref:hypothetical protein n=1 Tax=Chromobacterium violaceum TaxID=536 RepID=UPI001B31F392|nr:hypothetical protein [Chromobacterium violaceum]MBP4047289.1 hypothetical protein [Chromobacterium violaceum]
MNNIPDVLSTSLGISSDEKNEHPYGELIALLLLILLKERSGGRSNFSDLKSMYSSLGGGAENAHDFPAELHFIVGELLKNISR